MRVQNQCTPKIRLGCGCNANRAFSVERLIGRQEPKPNGSNSVLFIASVFENCPSIVTKRLSQNLLEASIDVAAVVAMAGRVFDAREWHQQGNRIGTPAAATSAFNARESVMPK